MIESIQQGAIAKIYIKNDSDYIPKERLQNCSKNLPELMIKQLAQHVEPAGIIYSQRSC